MRSRSAPPIHRPGRLAARVALALPVAISACIDRAPPRAPEPASADASSRPFLAPLELVDDRADDAIVRVVGPVGCSGALVAEDLVLTAHHCVVRRDARGRPLPERVSPEELRIELGGDDLPWGEVDVAHVVAPPCGHEQGAGDVAVLVLARPLPGMTTLTPRLHDPPTKGEPVAAWGFGRCARSSTAIRRHGRRGGAIEDVGAGVFHVQASVCPGDSGGPVLDVSSREVVGVVSAAVMDPSPATRDDAHFARIDVFSELFTLARELASGRDPSELPPVEACTRLAQPPRGLVAFPP
jgi:hypothetical protein